RLRFFRPRSTNVSAPAARRHSPTGCSPPCAMNSAVMSRSRQADRIGLGSMEANMSAVASPVLDSPRPMTNVQMDQLSINCIRTLSMDAVQQAKSGHPGTPMALAPLIYTLWNRVMRFDPQDPIWPNRDRFVLSNGHASMLLWSVLHLTGTRAVNAEYERLG